MRLNKRTCTDRTGSSLSADHTRKHDLMAYATSKDEAQTVFGVRLWEGWMVFGVTIDL